MKEMLWINGVSVKSPKSFQPEFFKIKYYDPKDGLITKTFYAGPKTMPMLRMKEGFPVWEGLKVNFIEQ